MTLNQVIDRITQVAQSHEQVSTVVVLKKEVHNYLNEEDVVYPCVLIDLQDGGGADRSTRTTTVPMRLFFLDAENISDDAQGNTVEVWSDRLSVAEDIIALLVKATDDEPDRDWRIDGGSNLSFYSEKFSDYVAGVSVDLSIRIPYNVNRCIAPITE